MSNRDNCAAVVPEELNLAELDPPLPVAKRVAPPCGDGGAGLSLWERRGGGPGLKSLEIQPFQLNSNINNSNSSSTRRHFVSPLAV